MEKKKKKKEGKDEREDDASDAISPVADFPTHPFPPPLTTTGTQLSMIYNL